MQVPVVVEAGQRVPVGERARRLVQPRILECHRGLVGHRPGERDQDRVLEWPAGEHQLDQADGLVLGHQGQHQEAPFAFGPQQRNLGRVRLRVGDIDARDHAPLEDLARQRVLTEVKHALEATALPCGVAAQRSDPVLLRFPGADLGARSSDRAGKVHGDEVRNGRRVERTRERAAHLEQLPELGGQAIGVGEVAGARERGGGLVGKRHEQAQVLVVELVKTQLGQGDDAHQQVVGLHRDDEHGLLHGLGARDRHPARVPLGVIDADRGPMLGHPTREPRSDLRPQDLEIHRVVCAHATLKGDGHEIVGPLEQVDAGVVVVDDAPRLLDHRSSDVLAVEARGHPSAACWSIASWAVRRASAERARPTREPVHRIVPPIVRSRTTTRSSSEDGPPAIAQPAIPSPKATKPTAKATAWRREVADDPRRPDRRRPTAARMRCTDWMLAARGAAWHRPKVPTERRSVVPSVSRCE